MPPLCDRAAMKPEIVAAVAFLSRFLRINGDVNDRQAQIFSRSLQDILTEQYRHHWFPDRPWRGSGFRCIRINHRLDPLVWRAGQRGGLSAQQLYSLLPSELTLWVDPFQVSYRIGEDGSICALYETPPLGPAPMRDSRVGCKEALLLRTAGSSDGFGMMTVSG